MTLSKKSHYHERITHIQNFILVWQEMNGNHRKNDCSNQKAKPTFQKAKAAKHAQEILKKM